MCDKFEARVSQLVDLDWGNSTEHLSEIMSNPVASKLFEEKSVLCIGVDFVPLPKGKKVSSIIFYMRKIFTHSSTMVGCI